MKAVFHSKPADDSVPVNTCPRNGFYVVTQSSGGYSGAKVGELAIIIASEMMLVKTCGAIFDYGACADKDAVLRVRPVRPGESITFEA